MEDDCQKAASPTALRACLPLKGLLLHPRSGARLALPTGVCDKVARKESRPGEGNLTPACWASAGQEGSLHSRGKTPLPVKSIWDRVFCLLNDPTFVTNI